MTGLLIRGARVFDGVGVRESAAVLVAAGRVAAVAGHLDVPGTPVVDGCGGTLLPGFVDAHVHAFPGSLAVAARFGVTTEIDMFNDPAVIASLRRLAAERSDVADLRSAGTGATVPGGHPTALVGRGVYRPFPTITAPGEAEDFVAARVAEGSDFVKVMVEDGTAVGRRVPTLPDATIAALVTAAHRRGLPVVAHATGAGAARRAVRCGVDGLTHVPVDRPIDRATCALLAQRDGFAIPTLTAMQALCGVAGARELAADPRVHPHLEPWRARVLASAIPGHGGPARFEMAVESVRRLGAAGVCLLAGTDASNPGTAHGVSLHRELALLVGSGLPAVGALAAATSAPARRFGLPDRGVIALGKRADLVLVRGDPTRCIGDTLDIVAVWRGGRQVDRTGHRNDIGGDVCADSPAGWTGDGT
jgi:imidazolonepropionase-like amidohydrolase